MIGSGRKRYRYCRANTMVYSVSIRGAPGDQHHWVWPGNASYCTIRTAAQQPQAREAAKRVSNGTICAAHGPADLHRSAVTLRRLHDENRFATNSPAP